MPPCLHWGGLSQHLSWQVHHCCLRTSRHHFGYHGEGLQGSAAVITCCKYPAARCISADTGAGQCLILCSTRGMCCTDTQIKCSESLRDLCTSSPSLPSQTLSADASFLPAAEEGLGMEAQSSSWAGHMAIPPEDRAVLSSLLQPGREETFCSRQKATPSFSPLQLTASNHTLAGGQPHVPCWAPWICRIEANNTVVTCNNDTGKNGGKNI